MESSLSVTFLKYAHRHTTHTRVIARTPDCFVVLCCAAVLLISQEELESYRKNSTLYRQFLRNNHISHAFNPRALNKSDSIETIKGFRNLIDHEFDAVNGGATKNARKCFIPFFAPAKGAV